jgi:hypothetical protein
MIDTSSALAIFSSYVGILCALRLTAVLERLKAIKEITFSKKTIRTQDDGFRLAGSRWSVIDRIPLVLAEDHQQTL